MKKVSAAAAVVLAGLLAFSGCSLDTGGMPAVEGVEGDASAGGSDGGGKLDLSAGTGGAGAGGQGTGGAPGTGGMGAAGSGGAQGGQGGQGAGGQGGAAVDSGADAPRVDVPGNLLGAGALCSFGNSCASGFCIDGVCCENACAGTCMACTAEKTGQLDGQCRTMKAATDPDSECDVETGTACGRTGRCGMGACELVAKGTLCGDRTCSGHQTTAAPSCSGTGQCISPAATACPGALKCASGTACATDCSVDGDCVGNWLCDNSDGKCKPGLGLGAACVVGATDISKQCMSGQCVDGVCCESACTGSCSACTFAKTGVRNGQCAAVSAGTDPDEECATEAASSCGKTGVCNGNGACKKYADGTACGTTCCTSNSGQGSGARPCTYVCRAGACDMNAPVPSQESCNGPGAGCCCLGGNGGTANSCVAALSCTLAGGTCM